MDLIFSILNAMKNENLLYCIYYRNNRRKNYEQETTKIVEKYINGKVVCYNPCIVNLAIRHAYCKYKG